MQSMNGSHPQDTGIEAQGLVREFKGGSAPSTESTCASSPARSAVPRPERRRKSTTVHMLTTLLLPPPVRRRSPATTWSPRGGRPRFDRRRPPGGRPRPAAHRPRAHAPPGSPPGSRRPSEGPGRGADRARRAHRGGGPQGRRLLRRDEAPARPGARPAPAARPLPRRAHHRPRHPEPDRALG